MGRMCSQRWYNSYGRKGLRSGITFTDDWDQKLNNPVPKYIQLFEMLYVFWFCLTNAVYKLKLIKDKSGGR